MKPVLVDTDILSLFLRGQQAVVEHFRAYLAERDQINFIITYYEIVSGLRHRDAHRQLEGFKEFRHHNRLLPLTTNACDIAAELYALLRKAGTPLDDIDLLIAGIAMENDMIIATRNTQHFSRIDGLEIENWSAE